MQATTAEKAVITSSRVAIRSSVSETIDTT
jgi:hypothetical protein